MSHHSEHRTGDESCPEGIPLLRTKAFACHDLTLWEAALLARERMGALRQVQRAEPRLARLGKRLALAALRAAEPLPVDPALAAVRAGERSDPGGVISWSGFGATAVIVPCVAIVLTAYLCLCAGVGNLSLPTEFLVLVVLLVMCPAHARTVPSGERSRTRAVRAVARYEKNRGKRALAVQCEHHRTWLALEAEVNRLRVAYHRGVELPEVPVILKPSLRLLEQYRPTMRVDVNP